MTRILSSDILIADVVVSASNQPDLQELIQLFSLRPGGKKAINNAQHQRFGEAISHRFCHIFPGGSSANVLVTLARLLEGSTQIDFIGVHGDSPADDMIRRSLEEVGIRLFPQPMPPGAQSATSYVLLLEDGGRTIATFPGNARQYLTAGVIDPELVRRADVVFLQGSLWSKMEPDYADHLLSLTLAEGKRLWLALPTYSMPDGEHVNIFRHLIAHAELVLGNEEELARIFRMTADDAIHALSAQLTAGQSAFITRAVQGAVVLHEGKVSVAPARPVAPAAIQSTLGAGDTAFAGFMAGMMFGLAAEQCAELAMVLAAEKLKVQQARLPSPKEALKQASPALYSGLYHGLDS